ncbi:MAG: TRAP transporter substrate-binding protein DctP [Alphaproteobacteria bacterium]|jgi:TRAP-type C4-dicarboxylate transport system substrate-binding protein|nr:TRAP transporter substrate-binding protein DctP [Alphaproteobacteria bacterium]MDP6812666.1 TRAP transporter substrate-binding protein DctP [Alphaproteobacteria bacterium]
MRKSFIKSAVTATSVSLLAFAMAGVSTASAKSTWNFNIWGGKRAFTKGIETLKTELEGAGGGEFSLKIHYGDALGPRRQNPENIRVGAFEAGQICVGYYPGKYPLLSVMELPFLLPRDLQQRANVEMEVLQHPAIVAELAKRWNSKFFGPAFLPAYEFMGNKRIETTADMKGVKMRISGLNAKALQVFGAVPTMVTAPDGYSALDRGTIDSFGFPYSYAFGAYKLYEVSKYVTEGLGMSGFMCLQTVNLDAWRAAPAAVKAAMPAAQNTAIAAMIESYTTADKKWIPIFHKKLEVVQVAPSERAKLAAGAGKIYAEWAAEQDGKGRPGSEMLKFVQSVVAKHTK